VEVGEVVERGQLIGSLLTFVGRRVPSHLHFELRDFLINPVVNGETPSYGVRCGVNCPPGPGYWPTSAPEHPTALGWRNPTHVINQRAFAGGILLGTDVIATGLAGDAVDLWSAPPDQDGAAIVGTLSVLPGDRFRLQAVATGPEASEESSAEGYHVWYQINVGPGDRAWVQAAVPSFEDTGSDGRPSGVTYAFLLDAPAE
jgi:murein DD-endopeptidase MepM/ murein hydrolase activator NlpD